MIDRMKLELALAHCVDQHGLCAQMDCGCCTYLSLCHAAGSPLPVIRDAREVILSMQKAQEPRLLTFDELLAIDRTDTTVFVERRTKTFYNEMAFVSVEKVYGDTVSFHGQKSIFGHSKKDYGKEWRCWTSRPSAAQMREVSWE